MKTRAQKPFRVNVVTLGCAKNTVDSETLLAQLRGNGVEAVHEAQERWDDIVVINTCGFIEDAKRQSIDTILRYAEIKRQGLIAKVYVTGCLSERYRDALEQEIPDVDAWFGSRDMSRLLRQLQANYRQELLGERILTSPCHFAYLKISEGCNRPCSFCAIPLMRGKHVSKPMEQVVVEARKLAAQGVKELLVIAQDTTFYGIDLYRKRMLAELLRRLADVDGLAWIRLHYAFPTGFPLDALNVMAERSNICKYLDMPLQHASTAVLEEMRRGITQEKTRRLIDLIRNKVPGMTLRTTMMVGHPGESEAEFEELMRFVADIRFDRLGVFAYSPEEGTASYGKLDRTSDRIKRRRMQELMGLQREISLEINREKVGKTLKTLIDRKEGRRFVGRTEADSPEIDNETLIESVVPLRVGDFVHVAIREADAFDLIGAPA